MRLVPVFAVLILVGCATPASTRKDTLAKAVTRTATTCGAEGGFACDRAAILAMAGNYKVSFHFDETVLLAAGYQPKPTKDTNAVEAVIVVRDEEKAIELQHLLVLPGGMVIKHWRQVWLYETPVHWVFTGAQTFETKERTEAERTGTWTQFVYEVSDAPRYAGLGKWNHRYGTSTWTSERTWRPLPRREYTTRSDYDLINAENRHTITPYGWTHEQDNSKVIRRTEAGAVSASGGAKDATITREWGFNEYVLTSDDLQAAKTYWEKTGPFWAEVRKRWDDVLSKGGLKLSYPVNEEKLVLDSLRKAEEFKKNPDLAAANAWLDEHFKKTVTAL